MADFYTTGAEEDLIYRITREGFGYHESDKDFHKYHILRVALGLALRLEKMSLNDSVWNEKKMSEDKTRGKEYHLQQLVGDDGEVNLLRLVFYWHHYEEMKDNGWNIFENDKLFKDILEKYLHRGLYEISNTWKQNDCIYQWCLDSLGMNIQSKVVSINEENQEDMIARIENFYRENAIPVKVMGELKDSLRHKICRVKVLEVTKIDYFEKVTKNLEKALGVTNSRFYSCNHLGISSSYDILIGKAESEWKVLGKREFLDGLERRKNQELCVLAGYSNDMEPYLFDIVDSKHLIVGGSSGSGKSVFLQTMVVSLLLSSKRCEIVFIDPKNGVVSQPFKDNNRVQIVTSASEANECLRRIVDEMEERYSHLAEIGETDIAKTKYPYKVVIIDELNDLTLQDKDINKELARLANKARQSGIYLVLGTQRPDAKVLDGELRSNVVSRIALKVAKAKDSTIILDEVGAEKLLGRGDMLIKIDGDSMKNILSVYLSESDIKSLISH